MIATALTAVTLASNTNWNPVVDAARRLTGQKTIAQNAAECLDELVDFGVIDQYLAEHDKFQEYLDSLN